MDISKLLEGFECSCGKIHTCDIDNVYIENGAILRLTKLCANYSDILLVADENTFSAAGEKTLSAIGNKRIKKMIFPGKPLLIPNEEAIKSVTESLSDISLIIGIGSGVIQDLCKYVSFFSHIPYMIVATAPSMDGYASNGAAMITNGMKVTYKAGLPRAIIADTAVLRNAPIDMIKAGYGDIIGKYSALNDWKLSRCVNGEYFCDRIYDLTMQQIKATIESADGILNRREDSINKLTHALIVVGILMSFAGSSRPASGSEHHLSHFFEITGIIDGTEYLPHGIDVAFSTVITAEVRENIRRQKFPSKIFRKDEQSLKKGLSDIYKQVATECIELQNQVGNYEADRINDYLQKEDEIKEILNEMPDKDAILKMLTLAELNINDFYDIYGKAKIRTAVLYAKDLKDRYTVLWLNYDLFGE